jgi:hypothetical protein
VSRDALAARLERLSAQERALLAKRLAGRRAGGELSIPRRDPDAPVPMSFAQWRLWFLEQLRPGTNAWNTPVAARIDGTLDVEALRRSLWCLIARHATLRTVFLAPGGKPRPVEVEPERAGIPLAVLEALAASDASVSALVDEEVARPFDLERGSMLRARLIRLGPSEHVLVLVAHHIACDGWSKGLLLEELAHVYEHVAAGGDPQLPQLPIEYADYAVWQRSRLSGEHLDELTTYWRSRLAGAPPSLALPADHPRPRRQAFRGAVEWVSIPAELAQRALELGRAWRATPFMTMLAAFTALLNAHSGHEDLLIGSPAAMRTHPELERIVGCFANTLVYRTSLAGDPGFRELVSRVRDAALGVYAHQELPFEKIVEAVAPPRDPSRNPLVQVNFRLEGEEPELRLPGTDCRPIAIDPGIARFDLALELAPQNGAFGGYLEYDTALFSAGTARRIASDYFRILAALVASPELGLAALEPVREIRRRA